MKNKPNKKAKKGISVRVPLVLFILYLTISYVVIGRTDIATEIVVSGRLEDAYVVNGYIVKAQSPIHTTVGGAMEPLFRDGERVFKGEHIASVYKGNVEQSVIEELRVINDEIAHYGANPFKKTIYANDAVAIEQNIGGGISNAIIAAYNKDGNLLSSVKDELNDLMSKKNIAMGNTVKVDENVIVSELEAKRDNIEREHGIQKVDLYAPVSGVFVASVDGLEDYLHPGLIKNTITPAEIYALDRLQLRTANEITPETAVCKIVDNYEWHFIAVVDTKHLFELSVGSDVSLRFFDVSDVPVPGTIVNISQEEDGKSVIIVAANGYVDSIYSMSRVSVDLIRKTYNGLSVPRDAVRVKDGVTGVYVLWDKMSLFKPVEILYTSGDRCIVKEENNVQGRLRLYDEVVIQGTDLHDGKLVR